MAGELAHEETGKEVVGRSLLFKGPTVVAALVCGVAAVFSTALAVAFVFSPGALRGTFIVDLSNGSAPSQEVLNIVGFVLMALGVMYAVSAVLLWSEVHWIRGVYVGIVVSMVGMLWSGLGTTFAPGVAAAGMLLNVLIITLLATETWEATRGIRRAPPDQRAAL